MKLKHLEAALSSITREFPSPKVSLEQYPTSAHLAASVIQLALDKGDLGDDKVCLDLGCGTGMLTVGAAFVSPLVISVDCDLEAIAVARNNVESVDLADSVLFVQAQVRTLSSPKSKSTTRGNTGRTARGRGRASSGKSARGEGGFSHAATDTKAILILDASDGMPFQDRSVDTVLTNPPFGTKHNAGMDIQFLRTACRLARISVYSFHKRSTRSFVLNIVQEWGYRASVVAEMAFDIPKMYLFHNQKTKDVEVDLIRVEIRTEEEFHQLFEIEHDIQMVEYDVSRDLV